MGRGEEADLMRDLLYEFPRIGFTGSTFLAPCKALRLVVAFSGT